MLIMFELSVTASFSAAHFLRDYKGKCENLHGHNWKVEAAVRGDNIDKSGLLIDFKKLKEYLNRVLGELDHQHLNELGAFGEVNPSSENIAVFIYRRLKILLAGEKVDLVYIKVWEQDNSAVLYREGR